MRIALLTDGIYPYVLGGMQKHSYYLAKYLARNGVFVDLYHTGSNEADTTQLKAFSEEELAFIRPYYVPFPAVGKLPGHYVLESYLYSAQIYQRLKENKAVDFIYAQGFAGWKTITEKKKDKTLPPVGVNFHGLNMYQPGGSVKAALEAQLLRLASNPILKKADYVISLGGKLTSILKQVGVNPNQILETPIAIEPTWISETIKDTCNSKKSRSFVFIGRYDKVKGIELLTQTISSIKQLNFKFSFIGPIPTEKQLQDEKVSYFGLIEDEQQIKTILATADVLVCPSYSEGMPTVILEAMASGLAVIATDVGAVSSLVNEDTGWLIPAGEKAALLQASLKAISCNQTELNAKKNNARDLIKNKYTWDKVIASTITQITGLVK